MATINFYRTSSDAIVVKKTLEYVDTRTLQFNMFDRINLMLTLKDDFDANYCQIDEKYYYIYNKVKDGKLYYYSLKLDVLMTYQEYILNSSQFVDRNEFDYDTKKIDSMVETKVDISKEYINLTPEFDANNVMPTSLDEDDDPHFLIAIYR